MYNNNVRNSEEILYNLGDFKMRYKEIFMDKQKRIALVAHDNKKQELVDWAKFNKGTLSKHIYIGRLI